MPINLNSIKTRLVLVLMAVLLAALVAGIVFLRPVMRHHFVDMARTQMSESAMQLSNNIDYYLDRAIAELRAVAATQEVSSFEKQRIDRVLLERAETNSYFTRMCVSDYYGKIVSSSNQAETPGMRAPEGRMPAIRRAIESEEPVFMNLVQSRYGTLTSGVVVPVYDRSGAARGVIIGIVEATEGNFMTSMLRDMAVEPGSVAYIVGTDGRLLAHSSLTLDYKSAEDYDYSGLEPVKAALAGRAGTLKHRIGKTGYYAAYHPIKSSGWGVIVQRDESVIEADTNNAMLLAVGIATAAFFLIALAQGLLINVSLRPLSLIAESLRRKKPLPLDLISKQKGEVAEMSREISALVEDIRNRDRLLEQMNEELEWRVQDRTSELSEMNKRLSSEIVERKLTEERLRDARRRFEDVTANTGDWIWEADEKGSFVFSSNSIERLIGVRPEEMLGKNFCETFMPSSSPELQKAVLSEFHNKKPFNDVVRSVTGRDGRTRLIETSGVPIFASSGEFRGYRGSARDVTERVLMDAKIKESLREKEVLLKEIHHRVKNNMQVISSLLNLQSRYVKDSDAASLFQESQNRLKAMALVHEKLYQSENLSQVNLSDYIRNLVAHLQASLGGGRVAIDLGVSRDMQLDIDTIIPCGLILNELISNSIKHAFKDREYGNVTLSMEGSDRELAIKVCDNGSGLPEGFDMEQGTSLGTRLISALTAQIGGAIEISSSDTGTCFTLRIPVAEKDESAGRMDANKAAPA